MQHLYGNPMPPHCAHLATQPVAACFGAAVVVTVGAIVAVVVVAVVVVLLVAVVVVVVVGAAAVVVVAFFTVSYFATFLGAGCVVAAAQGALDKS